MLRTQDEIYLLWYCGKKEKRLKLSSVTRIIPGQRTVSLIHVLNQFCWRFWTKECYCNNFSRRFSGDTLNPQRNINLFLLYMATVLLIWLVILLSVVFSVVVPVRNISWNLMDRYVRTRTKLSSGSLLFVLFSHETALLHWYFTREAVVLFLTMENKVIPARTPSPTSDPSAVTQAARLFLFLSSREDHKFVSFLTSSYYLIRDFCRNTQKRPQDLTPTLHRDLGKFSQRFCHKLQY